MKANPDFTLKCPNCGKPLEFDIKTSKYVCNECKSMWTFELTRDKIVWHEWKEAEIGSPLYDFIMATAVWYNDKNNKEEEK